MSFKEEFANLAPGPARDNLVFNEIVKRGPPKELVPITVTTPDGYKITYRVMPDYISIDGIRVPMAGNTAQRVADQFGMKLPTPKMTRQIWQAADAKIAPSPMSAGGTINGKYYTGRQVVDSKISSSDTSLAYNSRIDDELKGHQNAKLISGHMKDIVMPEDPSKLGLYGLYDKNGRIIQNSANTPHDTTVHTEYAAGTRLVGDKVIVTKPDGSKYPTTLDSLLKDPNMFKTVSDNLGARKYDVGKQSKDKAPDNKLAPPPQAVKVDHTSYSPEDPKSGRLKFLERIDNFLSQFGI